MTLGSERFGNYFPSALLVTSEPEQNGLRLWQDPIFGQFWGEDALTMPVMLVHERLGEVEAKLGNFDVEGVWFESRHPALEHFKVGADSYPWIWHTEHT